MHLTLEPRQAQKATGFSEDLAEFKETTAFPDDVEQITALTGRRIGPLARGPLPRARPAQPNKR